MVRKKELNCRNAWDQDLWEPKTPLPQRVQVGVDRDVAVTPPVFVPPPYATDRVLESSGAGIVGVVKPHRSPVGEQSSKLFHRVGDADDEDGDDELQWLPRTPGAASQVAAEALDDLPQSSRIGSAAPEHSRREGLQTFIDLPQEAAAEPTAVTATRHESADRPLPAIAMVGSAAQVVVHDARVEEDRAAQPGMMAGAAHNAQGQNRQLTEPLPELSESTQPTLTNGTSALPSLPLVDGTVPLPRRPLTFELQSRPAQRTSAQMVQGSKLANLRRCCGTCRDFKRNADGTSGICTNAYAFPDGAVVQSDALACSSSMGIWWLPNDDLFVNAVDTSHHSRPTPYLDAALGPRAGSEAGRDSRAW